MVPSPLWIGILAAAGCLALLASVALQRQTGIPGFREQYSDADGEGRVLVSERYGLVGKPDYLFWDGGRLIPEEVKPGRPGGRIYHSDVLQLAAYALLIEETYGTAAPYGLVRCGTTSHRVNLTPELRQEVLDMLVRMRLAARAPAVEPNHHSARRCAACQLRQLCKSPAASR